MRRVRVIPVLLLSNGGLVKTIGFKSPKYIGDPINAVRIFNEKEVDELVLLDINKTQNNEDPDYLHIKDIVSEAFMPLAYGGGIRSLDHIKRIIDCGIEKVVINTAAYSNPELLEQGAKIYGSQSIVVAVDVKRDWLGRDHAYVNSGKKRVKLPLIEYVNQIQQYGAGEVILTNIQHEGSFKGFDLNLISTISKTCHIPLVANGGARNIEDFVAAIAQGASAVSAGSQFVYKSKSRGILINYPSQQELVEKLYASI